MALLARMRIEQDSLCVEAILLPGFFHSLLALMLLEVLLSKVLLSKVLLATIVPQSLAFIIIVATHLSDRKNNSRSEHPCDLIKYAALC